MFSGATPKLDRQDLCLFNLKIHLQPRDRVYNVVSMAPYLHGHTWLLHNNIMQQPSVSLDTEVKLQFTEG